MIDITIHAKDMEEAREIFEGKSVTSDIKHFTDVELLMVEALTELWPTNIPGDDTPTWKKLRKISDMLGIPQDNYKYHGDE